MSSRQHRAVWLEERGGGRSLRIARIWEARVWRPLSNADFHRVFSEKAFCSGRCFPFLMMERERERD
jgi:hypothetical protein